MAELHGRERLAHQENHITIKAKQFPSFKEYLHGTSGGLSGSWGQQCRCPSIK